MQSNSIRVLQFGIQGNKEPFVDIPEDVRGCLAWWAGFSCLLSRQWSARASGRVLLYVLVFVAEWAARVCGC